MIRLLRMGKKGPPRRVLTAPLLNASCIRLARRIAFPALVLVGLIFPLLLTTWYVLKLQQDSQSRTLYEEINHRASLLAEGLADPIWNMIPDTGRALLQSFIKDPHVVRITVISLAQGGFLDAQGPAQPSANSLVLTRNIFYGQTRIGTFRLEVDGSGLAAAERERWWSILLAEGIQLLLAIAIVAFVVRVSGRINREKTLRKTNLQLSKEIEERNRVEQELRASHRLLRIVIDTQPHHIFFKDREGFYKFVNKALATHHGIPESDFIGKKINDLPMRSESERSLIHEQDRTLFETENPIDNPEIKFTAIDGQIGFYHQRKILIKNENGEVIGLLGVAENITEEKNARDELIRIQNQFQIMLDNIPHTVVIKDTEARYLFANKAWCETYGVSLEDVINKTSMGIPGRSKAERIDILKSDRAFFEGTETRVEYEHQRTDKHGKLLTMQNIRSKVLDKGNKIIGMVTIAYDISEKRLVEKELRSSQRLLQTVFNSIPHWVFAKDSESRYTMVNRAFAESYRMHPEDFKGRENPARNESDMKFSLETDRRVMESGQEMDFGDHLFHLPDGKRRVSRVYKSPMFDDDGNVVGIVGVADDVTEQRDTENALRRSEEQLKLIADNLPVLISLMDAQEKFLFVNATCARWFGAPANEIVGKTVKEMHGANYSVFGQQIKKALNGEEVTFETESNYPDGTKRYVLATYIPRFGESAEVIGFYALVEDRTIQWRTEEQLRQSQKMEAFGQLAGGVAHDFNNLLQVIISYSQLARDNLDQPEKLPNFLDNVIKAGNRAASLTRQLLAFSRKSVLQLKAMEMNDLTFHLMKMVERVIGEDIELILKLGPEIRPTLADSNMIEQVIFNLCVNARDAMPKGGQLVIETSNVSCNQQFCDLHRLEHPGDYIMLSVRDNGVGMTPEVREQVFEPFFTTKEVGQGTGLGLAMVHGIVQQHNGVIEVVSETGIGTNFKIYLPATEPEPSETADADFMDITGGSETILVAEDEQHVRELLADLLDSKGYRVLTAEDGERAIELFASEMKSIDLVILDAVLPKMNGRDVFSKIRKINPDVGVIFSTGYSDTVLDTEFLNTNGLRLIQKPYSPNDLFKNVRDVLDQN